MAKIGSLTRFVRLMLKRKKYRKSNFARLGNDTIVNQQSRLVPRNMFLEDNVIIQSEVNFISYKGKLIIGKYSVISSGCIIVPSKHIPIVGVPFYYATKYHIGDEDDEINIKEDCWIGAGCILLPGITIGRGSIVGAGSVVTKDIPPYSIAVGSPARVISVKFSVEDIIAHERALYQESERLKIDYLRSLFDTAYKGLPIAKKAEMSADEKVFLRSKLKNE